MYRSFVFPREALRLLSRPGQQLRLVSPHTILSGQIFQLKRAGPIWDDWVVTVNGARCEEAEWILTGDLLRISPLGSDCEIPAFSTQDESIIDHLLSLGAEEIIYESPHQMVRITRIIIDNTDYGWVEQLVCQHPSIGIAL